MRIILDVAIASDWMFIAPGQAVSDFRQRTRHLQKAMQLQQQNAQFP
jgi:hypothetical protein